MKALLPFVLAAFAWGAAPPLYVFDNGTGRGDAPIEEQAAMVKAAGYAGIFYTGTLDIPHALGALRERGLGMLGIYTGTNLSQPDIPYDPGLPEAIRQLRGTGAVITFTIQGTAANGDDAAVAILRRVAAMAADSGLQVGLYFHYGFYMATVGDALRLRQKAGRDNIGLVFNLCHSLRNGDEPEMTARLKEALPHTLMLTVNGADHEGDWDRLIQTLDRGTFDVRRFLRLAESLGYRGPIALQCYNVKGDRKDNLERSMRAWREMGR